MEPWLPDLIRTADSCLIVIDPADPDALDMLQFIQDKLGEKKIRLAGKGEPAAEHSWRSKRALVVANKIDLTEAVENLGILREFIEPDFPLIPVSAHSGEGLEELKQRIFAMLEVIRVYSKIPGKKAELNDPFTLKKGSTVMDMARAVHKDFSQKLRFARIWSENKYDGQRVNRHHLLEDEDIIELHI
jgi:ribosome-interacting GTPase 1